MNCIENTARYILYIFNILFLIGGILLIVLGSLMLSDMGHFKTFDQAIHTETIPIIIIVLGCVIFIISFFGCYGAIKENVCCSWTYIVFMFILFCLQVALVVWIFVKRSEFYNTMADVVQAAWNENTESQGYPMEALELAFNCCGLNGYQDYAAMNLAVPSSCCGDVDTSDVCPSYYYMAQPACQTKFVDFWRHTLYILRWGGVGVAIVELIAIIFASCVITGAHRAIGEVYEVEIIT